MSVYFARVKGYVKIGYSKDPERRVLNITSGSCLKPEDVTRTDRVDLLGWFPGDRRAERAAHMALGRHHVVGEWFLFVPEVEHYLRSHEDAVDPRDALGDLARLVTAWFDERHRAKWRVA